MGQDFNYKSILNEIARNDEAGKKISGAESEKLKTCLFEMAVDIDKRCRKNNLSIFLVGGSLLGAVRHGGFIPWDDDMDFGLFRRDYEKLKEIFDDQFGDEYELRCPNTKYPNGNRFMQIFKRGTTLKTMGGDNPFSPQSVYIDIFPYDYVPNNRIIRRLVGTYANALMLIASCVMDEHYMTKDYRNLLKASKNGKRYLQARSLIGKAFSFIPPEKWFDKVDNAIKPFKGRESITSATGRRHYFGEIYKCNQFLPLTELAFNGHYFFAPNDYEAYLMGNYGKDYMAVPSKNNRETHFITELTIGE